MIKKNLVSFIAAATMVLSIGAISANAAVENGIDLEYVASDIATERIINIYYVGDLLEATGVSGTEIYLKIDGATVEDYTLTLPTSTSEFKFDYDKANDASDLSIGSVAFALFSNGGIITDNQLLATLSLTVPEETGEFSVSLDADNYSYLFDGTQDMNEVACEDITITIPGATVEEDKDPFVSATAEYLGRYDADKTSVPVDAWTATIDWSSYEATKALNWTLSVNGEEKSVAAATQTEITGEMTVVYGLAIAGQAEAELNTIDKDNVVLK